MSEEYFDLINKNGSAFAMDIDGLAMQFGIKMGNVAEDKTKAKRSLDKITDYIKKIEREYNVLNKKSIGVGSIHLCMEKLYALRDEHKDFTLENASLGLLKLDIANIFKKHGVPFVETPDSYAHKVVCAVRERYGITGDFDIRLNK